MSLQLIMGNSGSGKSHCLYEQIIESSIQYEDKNYIVLVPEQFTMQTQKELVLKHPKRGIRNIDVLSFGRLAHRIFEEVGQEQKIVLDDVGKNLILRKLAKTHEKELKILGRNLKKIGYISEVKSLLSEFTQYDIGEEELEHMLSVLGESSYLYWKLSDVKVMYHNFRKYLKDRYITGEELLDVLSGVIGKSVLLKGSTVVLDGFTGFTPVQNRVIGELLSVCGDVIVTVTQGAQDARLFDLSSKTVSNLRKIAQEKKCGMKESICLFDRPAYRFRESRALAFLESEIFRYAKHSYAEQQEDLSIHAVRNPVDETMYAAGEIRRLVRTEGWRYRDIAVIVSDMGSYAEYIEKSFRAYEIPVFMDYKRSILLNVLVEYVRSFLFLAEQNFTYESVFRFLRTGLCGVSEEETDILENYVKALGIRGLKKWEEPWIRLARGMSAEALAQVNQIRSTIIEAIRPAIQILKQRKKSVAMITEALYDLMTQEQMQQKMSDLEETFRAEGKLALAKEYAQIYSIVMELFDKFVELLGAETVSLKEYCELLDAGLEEAKVGIIPPGIDQVVIGDIERTRLKDVKALFFLGLNDLYIPGKNTKNGLLSERDREAFEAASLPLAPGSKEQMYIQKFYLYLNLTKPSRKLFLSYSKMTADGKSLRPAYLIPEIRKLYPALSVVEEELKQLTEQELTRGTGIACLLDGFQDKTKALEHDWLELYAWYRRDPEYRSILGELLEAGFYKKPQERLSKAMAEAVYDHIESAGVTRMERFAMCAYAHFMTYGLKLQERQEYSFEALDLGNVFHKALEHFSYQLQEAGYTWTDIPEEETKRLVEVSIEASIADYGNTVLYSTARSEYMITRIRRFMERTIWALTHQLAKGDFVPSGYEVSFLKGKIDRIDTYEDEERVYVKVIDYKTGSKAFDLTALYHGLQLQLAVYMGEALKLEAEKHKEKSIVPAGIFYYQMKDPIVAKEVSDDKLSESILKELKPDGLVNDREEVIGHLDREFTGNSLVVPVGRNKDRTLAKASKTVTEEEFQTLIAFAEQTTEKLKEQILNGETDAAPYQLGVKTGCEYCSYRNICGFDVKIEGFHYRRLKKMKKEEILERMAEECGEE